MLTSLEQLHPTLKDAIPRILAAMSALGHPMIVTGTVRTVDEQKALFAKGRTAPGSIVTNCDGIVKKSNHQLAPDGFGHAVDCTFVKDGKPSWDNAHPWKAYGECAKALGLKWGGDFHSITDRPHIEL